MDEGRISDRRVALGLSAQHLAGAIGVSRVTWSRIENGRAGCSALLRAKANAYLDHIEAAHGLALRHIADMCAPSE